MGLDIMSKQLELFFDPLIARYLYLTQEQLPRQARRPGNDWPVRHDHCFQRIVLDTVCGGVWYAYLDRPAYRHMTQAQLQKAISLCHEIMCGTANLHALNAQSIAWRRAASGDG